jgi:acylphosphatase
VDASLIRRRVVVHGLVQGVGFRYSLTRIARSRGAAGWVRNLADGSVEAVFEAAPDTVGSLVDWCDEGPRGAEVDRVEVIEEEPEGLSGFTAAP